MSGSSSSSNKASSLYIKNGINLFSILDFDDLYDVAKKEFKLDDETIVFIYLRNNNVEPGTEHFVMIAELDKVNLPERMYAMDNLATFEFSPADMSIMMNHLGLRDRPNPKRLGDLVADLDLGPMYVNALIALPDLSFLKRRTQFLIKNEIQLFYDNEKETVQEQFEQLDYNTPSDYVILPTSIKIRKIKNVQTLEWIFDHHLHCTEEFKCIVLSTFHKKWFKIFDDYKPPMSELDLQDESIFILGQSGKSVIRYSEHRHLTGIEREFFIEYSYPYDFTVFNLDLYPETFKDIKCSYTIPKEKFDYNALSHLILVDPLIETRIVKDDTASMARRLKNIIRLHVISDPNVKIMLQNADGGIMVKLSGLLRCEDIVPTQIVIAKVMSLYKKAEKDILSFYSMYIPNSKPPPSIEENAESPTKDETLRNQYPDIFVDKYSRLCSLGRNPKLSLAKSNDEKTMLFPKNSETPICLSCGNNKEYPYIGVVKNNLKNSETYSHLPCCFKTNQLKNKKYLEYMAGGAAAAAEGPGVSSSLKADRAQVQKRFIEKFKFVKENKFGLLPPELYNPMYFDKTFIRRGGVEDYVNSFIDCILTALEDGYKELSTKNKLKKLITTRKSFLKLDLAVVKQECWDISPRQLIDTPTEYFDPALFIRLMEDHYNVKIIWIQRQENGDIHFPNPRNHAGHFINKIKYPTSMIVYEHYGGIWATKRKCELVMNSVGLQATFDDERIQSLFKPSSILWKGNDEIGPQDYPESIKSQTIDRFGKVYEIETLAGNTIEFDILRAPFDGIPVIHKNREKETAMDLWRVLERNADLIKQYILYKWVQHGKPEYHDQFFRSLLEISNRPIFFNYFLDDNPETIAVPDQETMDGIVQTLVIDSKWVRDIPTVHFNNFYRRPGDWKKYPGETILLGEHSLNFWNKSIDLHMFEKIKIPKDNIVKLDGEYYYQRPAKQLATALHISKIWRKYHYITEFEPNDSTKKYKYSAYYIQGDGKISKRFEKGTVSNKYDMVILVDIQKFSAMKYHALLPLSHDNQPYTTRYENNNYIIQPTRSYHEAVSIGWMWKQYRLNTSTSNSIVPINDVKVYKCNADGDIIASVSRGGSTQHLSVVGYKVLDTFMFSAMLAL